MWVYKLTNKVTGQSYIGATTRPVNDRFSRHCYSAKKLNKTSLITLAIAQYGRGNFLVETLHEAKDKAEMLALEEKEIKKHRTLAPKGYNICYAGTLGRKNSPETRKKMGAGKIGKPSWNSGTSQRNKKST